MKVLVTGGTGVIGRGVIPALLGRGHEVRVLSRHAERDARQWPHGVEARRGDVASASAMAGAAEGCQAIVHVAGIAAETPPEATFETVNVGGTANVVTEAQRAGVARLVFVSSVGAERGASAYHRSKARAEEQVRRCTRPWVIVRPGNVYGPGDAVLSKLLQMVRTLPVVPIVDDGRQRFQPVWYADLGQALALAVDGDGVVGRVLEVAGTEVTTPSEVLDILEASAGRKVKRVRIPGALAQAGLQVAGLIGVPTPINDSQLAMLLEENVIVPGRENALVATFGLRPLPLARGLRQLEEVQPEKAPAEGVGPVHHKRYWADVDGSFFAARALRDVFRREVAAMLPLEARRPGGPLAHLKKNQVLSLTVPLRGVLAMRVEDVTPERVTLATLEGHPLAGLVEFSFLERGRRVRFAVEVFARGAGLADAVLLQTVGAALQDVNWREVVRRVVERSGGTAAAGVQTEARVLGEEEAAALDRRVGRLVLRRRRGEAPVPPAPPRPRAKAAAGKPATAPSRSPRRPAGTGSSAGRSRGSTGSGRSSGAGARPAAAPAGSRRSG